jgi:glutathione S-transferase
MANLKLLGPASFRSFRCLWMLEELGLPYQHVPSMPQSKEVKEHNPLGKVPVLIEEDGFTLYESSAINTYLGDKYRIRNPTLVPPVGTRQRAIYDQTISVLGTELDAQGLWIHRKHESLGDLFTHVPDAVTHARKYFNKTNRALIGQLKEGGPHLLGQDFTAADIFYVHCLDWSKSIGWDAKWKEESCLVEYLKLCKARPAYVKVRAMRDTENIQRKRGKGESNQNSNL